MKIFILKEKLVKIALIFFKNLKILGGKNNPSPTPPHSPKKKPLPSMQLELIQMTKFHLNMLN